MQLAVSVEFSLLVSAEGMASSDHDISWQSFLMKSLKRDVSWKPDPVIKTKTQNIII